MAITLLSHTSGLGSGVASSAISTTGASLLLFAVADNGITSLVDSQSNFWDPLGTVNSTTSSGVTIRLFWCARPVTSATHTVTYSGGFPAYVFAAFSGVDYLDTKSGSGNNFETASNSSTSLAVGNITPSVANCLLVTAVGLQAANAGETVSGDSLSCCCSWETTDDSPG